MELIDRKMFAETLEALTKDEWNINASPGSWATAFDECLTLLNEQPPVNAKPVVHGKWIPVKGGFRRCSRCKIAFSILANSVCNRNFCPNCGADMRKENNK